MALSDRIRRFAGRAGSALVGFSRAAPRVPGVGMPPQTGYVADPKQAAKANAFDALFGRITYGAGPTLTRYSTYPATGLNPATIYAILQEADKGIVYRFADLCEQVLERDAHMAGVDRSRRSEVSSKPFRIHALSGERVAQLVANFIRAAVDQIDSFDSSIYALLGANCAGWSLAEIVWESGRLKFPGPNGETAVFRGLLPRSIEWVHAKHTQFERDTDEPLINLGTGGLTPFPEYKFVFHGAAGDGFYEHRGYMRRVIYLHMMKQRAWKDWALFSELFGIPQILGKYEGTHQQLQELKAIYQQVLADMGKGIPGIVPSEFNIEITPGPTGASSVTIHQAFIGAIDAAMSKAIQCETLTTEMTAGGIGSYNAAESHAAVKHRVIETDARALACDIRRDLFRPLVKLNVDRLAALFGEKPEEILASVSRCSWRTEREVTPYQRAQIADLAINKWGMELDEEQLRDEFAFEKPRPGSTPLKGAPMQVPSGAVTAGALDAARGVDNPKPEDTAKGNP